MDRQSRSLAFGFFIAGLIGYASQLKYNGYPMTAFEWPSIDMGPFFERWADPNFLKDDFVVDSMNTPNPRWIFGYQVIALMKLLGLNWHQSFLLLKSSIVTLLPGFMFFFFIEACQSLLRKSQLSSITTLFALFMVVFIFFSRSLQYQIMIGDYLQSELKATPHSLATLSGLIGSVLLFRNSCWSFPFFITSSLTHPSVGFLFCCFNIIFNSRLWKFSRLLGFISLNVILPFVLLVLLFGSERPLSTFDLIQIYIKTRLPHHYDITSWDKSRLIINMSYFVGFFTIVLLIFWKNQKKVFASCSLALFAYLAAIYSQYFFIHVYPLRSIILLGPVRITAFSFIICAPFCLAIIDEKISILRWPNHFNVFSSKKWMGAWLMLLLFVFTYSEKNPLFRIKSKAPEFYNWVETHTESTDTFVGPLDIFADEFVLIANRSVFISQIFPFSEELYPEYQRRWTLIYGPIKSASYDFFISRTLAGWQQVLRDEAIDFIVFPVGIETSLKEVPHVYSDELWRVYGRRELLSIRSE